VVSLPPIAKLSEVEVDAALLAEAHKILELRKRGLSHYEIALKFEKSVYAIKKIEEDCRDMVFATISPVIENDRHLLVAQLNQVIKDARVIAESSYEYTERLSALNTIVKAIATKSKIIGLESNGPNTVNNNTLITMGPNEAKMRMEIQARRMLKEQSAQS
jgi:hypothetical protein